MTAFEKYTKKKADIAHSLNTAFYKKLKNKNAMDFCTLLSLKFKISKQTVYNYVRGNVTDGYLAEALLLEIRATKWLDI